jgi:hypothetical protein
VLRPVLANHGGRAHLRDRSGHDLDVRLRERGIPLVRRQDPLAADAVVRRELPAQLRVLDLLVHVPQRNALEQLADRAVAEQQHERLACPVDRRPHRELGRGKQSVEPLLQAADRAVAVRDHPGRGALEHLEPADLRLDLGDELDRRGAGAHDSHALAGEVVLVVPAGGVEGLALEALEARDLR